MSSRSGNVIYKKQFWLNEEQVKKLREKSISTNKKECELISVNVNIKMYKKGKITMYKRRNIICLVCCKCQY